MGDRVDAHCDFVRRCAEGRADSPQYLEGMRSWFFDAAHLVDIWRKEIEEAGRPSKAKAEKIALLQQIGDAVWAMRDLLPSPGAQS